MNNTIKVIGAALIVGLLALSYFLWKEVQESHRWQENYEASIDSLHTYKSKTDGAIVSYKQTIMLTQKELKKALKEDSIQRELVKKYKKLAEATTIITEWKHDTIKIGVPIFIERDTIIPYQDKCFNVDLSFKSGLFTLSDMQIYNRQDIVSGVRKIGFLKWENAIDVRNTNPCIITTGITNYRTVIKPKWYENPLVWGAAGFVGGFYVNHLIH